MAELHIIGQVEGASGFDGHSIFCKVRRGRQMRCVLSLLLLRAVLMCC